MSLNISPNRYRPFVRYIVVDAEGNGDFTTPGAACTYLNSQTRDNTHYWQVEVRPGNYLTESAIAVPSYTKFFNPFFLDPSRSYEFGEVPLWRHPGGNLAAPFITLGDRSVLVGIVADLFTNVTPTGTCSVVQANGLNRLYNCRLTGWCSAASQIVSSVEIAAGAVLYASGTLFAVQSATGANRTNARAVWAKGGMSFDSGCRFHDDDQVGGTGIYFDTTVESTISFCRFGTHPKSQFTTDINMNANGNLWLLYSKWWTTAGAFAANARVQEDEV
jgi:hypothetical protein